MKLYLLVIISVFYISSDALGQQEIKNNLKANFVFPVLGIYTIGYERALSTNTSGQIEVSLLNNNSVGEYNQSGSQVAFQYRIYFRDSRKAFPKGFYIAPYLNLKQSQFKSTSNIIPASSWKVSFITPGVIAGYQFLIKKFLTLDFYAGGGYSIPIISVNSLPAPSNLNEIKNATFTLNVGAFIGIAF